MAVVCPYCSTMNPDIWSILAFQKKDESGYIQNLRTEFYGYDDLSGVPFTERYAETNLIWMWCQNDSCREPLIRIHHDSGLNEPDSEISTWWALPRTVRSQRKIDSDAKGPFRTDYLEAAAILDDSPRMSVVLSRRILAELLRKYAGRAEFKLDDQIKHFLKDEKFPDYLKRDLNHLREMGNFGAHEQTDKATGEILDVSRGQAEWALDVIDALFEFFIAGPERSKRRREEMDKKIAQARRTAIKE